MIKDIKIKDAQLVSELKDQDKLPISDGSGDPKGVSIDQIKQYVQNETKLHLNRSNGKLEISLRTKNSDQDITQITLYPADETLGGIFSAANYKQLSKVLTSPKVDNNTLKFTDGKGEEVSVDLPDYQTYVNEQLSAFKYGIKQIAVQPLSETATLEEVIAGYNTLIQALKDAGINNI